MIISRICDALQAGFWAAREEWIDSKPRPPIEPGTMAYDMDERFKQIFFERYKELPELSRSLFRCSHDDPS